MISTQARAIADEQEAAAMLAARRREAAAALIDAIVECFGFDPEEDAELVCRLRRAISPGRSLSEC